MNADPQTRWYELVRRLGYGPSLRPLDPEEAWAEYQEAPDRPAPETLGRDSRVALASIEHRIEHGIEDETERLLERARANSESAWRELHRRYRTLLVTQIQARIPGRAPHGLDADDLLQEVLAKAWSGLASFEYRGEGSFRRWLSSLVDVELRKELASLPCPACPEPPRLDALELVDAASVGHSQPDQERLDMLAHMGELGQEDRDILAKYHLEGMSFDAIAAALGISRERTRRLHELALDRLRRRLKESRE
jgi:RNA polymerase sigma factor (sigma-70 family)